MSIVITKKDMNTIMSTIHSCTTDYVDCTVFTVDGLVRLDVTHVGHTTNAYVGFKDSDVVINLRNVAFGYDSDGETWAICDEFDSIHEFIRVI